MAGAARRTPRNAAGAKYRPREKHAYRAPRFRRRPRGARPSGPRLPDELIKTADDIYIRFHGTKSWYRHDYTKPELAVWTARIRDSGAARVWAYFNNDREGYAIKNARELMWQLK